ncbi:MAG: DUF488 domain-containing protein [Solirubrobacterales bacterium]|nr:DUF488 domain-containing protein [Solirubrobacterales bacterium]
MGAGVYTLGHGNRTTDEFVELLQSRQIEYAIDVRSFPYSKYFPDFNQEQLQRRLMSVGIGYLFLGAELGGRPDDPTVYVDGRVDYGLAAQRAHFIEGIDRVLAADRGGHRVCLVCSEKRPETCHRTKLVAEELRKRDCRVTHIDESGTDRSQDAVMARIDGGQLVLSGLAESATSIGRYNSDGRKV